ncbi:hypothetical protein [Verrucomicrobium sp. BvORR034]|jgi:hypothetical protein|uniref:hypothetical protein n=1 Tax=Verrucomicrobium sp. BvORR034 TaxID=1396418 RepID=UPI000A9173A4|nr:hypothetical protein [Verrucomicrobium sp. BvORR034]
MSIRNESLASSSAEAAMPLAGDLAQRFSATRILEAAGLVLTVLPPSIQSQLATTSLWVHDEALARIQRFRGSVYEEQGTLPLDAMRVGRRYTLACDTQNFHLVLNESNGPLAASLRFRFYRPGTTASGLKLFESVRRMPPAQGVLYTSTINAAVAEGRSEGRWVVEVSGLAVASAYHGHPAIRLLPLAALALIRSMTPSLVFALIPQMPFASFIFDGFQEQVFGLGSVDTMRLPAAISSELDPLMEHMLGSHPHLANCQPTDGDESLPPLFFQQTGSRPGVGTYR